MAFDLTCALVTWLLVVGGEKIRKKSVLKDQMMFGRAYRSIYSSWYISYQSAVSPDIYERSRLISWLISTFIPSSTCYTTLPFTLVVQMMGRTIHLFLCSLLTMFISAYSCCLSCMNEGMISFCHMYYLVYYITLSMDRLLHVHLTKC